MFPVRSDHLAAIGVSARLIATYLDPLNAAMAEHAIAIGERPAMFVAQVAHESGLFRYTSELWGPTPQQLKYSGSLAAQLGNSLPGDGSLFRGHGLIQVTGRANHAATAKRFSIPMEDIVAWLQSPVGACRSAGHFWQSHGCNELADQFDFVGVTRRINGGINGLAERTSLYAKLATML